MSPPGEDQRHYLRFFFPLALSSAIFVLGLQFRNAILARYPEAARELATFAYAFSTFVLLWSANNFVPQMANVYARSDHGYRLALRVVGGVNLCTAALLALIACTPVGDRLLTAAFTLDPSTLAAVQVYLYWLVPALPLSGLQLFYEGLLVQAQHTRLVTASTLLEALLSVATLVIAFGQGLPATWTLPLAIHVAGWVRLAFVYAMVRRFYRPPARPEHEQLRAGEVLRFMVPTTTTSVMFTLSRPVVYSFLSRTEDPLIAVAAFRVAYDVLAALQNIGNQFRHFFVTFGLDGMKSKRRFMAKVCLALTSLLGLAVLPGPGRNLIFGAALGLDGEVYDRAVAGAIVLLPAPAALMLRNYYHGQLLALRAPSGMALAATLRVGALALICGGLLWFGLLSTEGAALALLSSFAMEAAASGRALARVRRRGT